MILLLRKKPVSERVTLLKKARPRGGLFSLSLSLPSSFFKKRYSHDRLSFLFIWRVGHSWDVRYGGGF